MSTRIKCLAIGAGVLAVMSASIAVVAQSQRGVPSDYSLDYSTIGQTADFTTSSDYSVDSSVQVLGVQGGSTNSTDYSVTSGVAVDGDNSENVGDWESYK